MEKDKRTFKIIGAAMEVHKEMGCGFLEGVYQEALGIEFRVQGIPYKAQPVIEILYKGKPLEKKYQPDFMCFGEIIVEIKALERLIFFLQRFPFVKYLYYRLCLIRNSLNSKFYFKCFLIDTFQKTTPHLLMYLHSCTNYFVCPFIFLHILKICVICVICGYICFTKTPSS